MRIAIFSDIHGNREALTSIEQRAFLEKCPLCIEKEYNGKKVANK